MTFTAQSVTSHFWTVYLEDPAHRCLLIAFSHTRLDDKECLEATFAWFGTVNNVRLTDDRRVAFIDFACEHGPLLFERCYKSKLKTTCDELKQIMPKNVDGILPGCSIDNFLFLYDVPPALSTAILHHHFIKFFNSDVTIHRPGSRENGDLSTQVVVELRRGTTGAAYHQEKMRHIEIAYNGRNHMFYVVPPAQLLMNSSGVFDSGECEDCNLDEFSHLFIKKNKKKEETEASVLKTAEMCAPPNRDYDDCSIPRASPFMLPAVSEDSEHTRIARVQEKRTEREVAGMSAKVDAPVNRNDHYSTPTAPKPKFGEITEESERRRWGMVTQKQVSHPAVAPDTVVQPPVKISATVAPPRFPTQSIPPATVVPHSAKINATVPATRLTRPVAFDTTVAPPRFPTQSIPPVTVVPPQVNINTVSAPRLPRPFNATASFSRLPPPSIPPATVVPPSAKINSTVCPPRFGTPSTVSPPCREVPRPSSSQLAAPSHPPYPFPVARRERHPFEGMKFARPGFGSFLGVQRSSMEDRPVKEIGLDPPSALVGVPEMVDDETDVIGEESEEDGEDEEDAEEEDESDDGPTMYSLNDRVVMADETLPSIDVESDDERSFYSEYEETAEEIDSDDLQSGEEDQWRIVGRMPRPYYRLSESRIGHVKGEAYVPTPSPTVLNQGDTVSRMENPESADDESIDESTNPVFVDPEEWDAEDRIKHGINRLSAIEEGSQEEDAYSICSTQSSQDVFMFEEEEKKESMDGQGDPTEKKEVKEEERNDENRLMEEFEYDEEVTIMEKEEKKEERNEEEEKSIDDDKVDEEEEEMPERDDFSLPPSPRVASSRRGTDSDYEEDEEVHRDRLISDSIESLKENTREEEKMVVEQRDISTTSSECSRRSEENSGDEREREQRITLFSSEDKSIDGDEKVNEEEKEVPEGIQRADFSTPACPPRICPTPSENDSDDERRVKEEEDQRVTSFPSATIAGLDATEIEEMKMEQREVSIISSGLLCDRSSEAISDEEREEKEQRANVNSSTSNANIHVMMNANMEKEHRDEREDVHINEEFIDSEIEARLLKLASWSELIEEDAPSALAIAPKMAVDASDVVVQESEHSGDKREDELKEEAYDIVAGVATADASLDASKIEKMIVEQREDITSFSAPIRRWNRKSVVDQEKDEEYRSMGSEYNDWLTRVDVDSRGDSMAKDSSDSEAEIVPLPSSLPGLTWGGPLPEQLPESRPLEVFGRVVPTFARRTTTVPPATVSLRTDNVASV